MRAFAASWCSNVDARDSGGVQQRNEAEPELIAPTHKPTVVRRRDCYRIVARMWSSSNCYCHSCALNGLDAV